MIRNAQTTLGAIKGLERLVHLEQCCSDPLWRPDACRPRCSFLRLGIRAKNRNSSYLQNDFRVYDEVIKKRLSKHRVRKAAVF